MDIDDYSWTNSPEEEKSSNIAYFSKYNLITVQNHKFNSA